ncbi:MAG: hypothetical protein AAF481_03425 [Acidobacteriota bacterium]
MNPLKQQRERLEQEILMLICEFERRTGLSVLGVDLDRVTPPEDPTVSIPDAVDVRLEVSDELS